MSVKHIKKYYEQISNDYVEMLDAFHELEDLVAQQILSQEKLDETTKVINNLKENYMRWSYMMYLLNLPNNKEKKKSYEKRFSKQLDKIPKKDRIENVLQENKASISDLKKGINNLKQ